MRLRRTHLAAAAGPAAVVLVLVADLFVKANLRLPPNDGEWDVFYEIVVFLGIPAFAIAGGLIVARQPRNTIGWLLLAIPVVAALAFTVGDYATFALVTRHGAAPLGRLAAWIDRWAIVPSLCLLIPLFMLFPDGRIPSRRWRPALWFVIAAPAVTTLSFAVTPGRMTGAFAQLDGVQVVNPVGIRAAGNVVSAVTVIGGISCVLAALLAGASLVVRFRARRGDERQQIKWLALVGVAFLAELAVTVVLGALLGESSAGNAIGNLMFALMFVTLAFGIPIACAIAVLKYRLYDLELVVRKTLVVGALAVFVTAVYAIVVAGIGTAVGTRGDAALSFAAAVILAVLFQSVRERVMRLADRLVLGKRATPYEVLAEFSEDAGAAFSTQEVLPRMVRILAEGVGAKEAAIWLRGPSGFSRMACFPDGDRSPAEVRAVDVEEPTAQAGVPSFPVLHRGEELGMITLAMTPADPLTPPKEKLIRDFASQTGHVLRNARLVRDLRASRARLVAAQDRERRALERNIHDGAQQQLVALAVKTKLVEGIARNEGTQHVAQLLVNARVGAQAALENLRDLARGIYPPLLADQGLAAALEAQARKSPMPVTVESHGLGRYVPEVEAAVYFCTLEALQNAGKYANASSATVSFTANNAGLAFEVNDDGVGFDPADTQYGTGLQGIADRLDALGGTLEIHSSPGCGTSIRGRLPAADTEATG